MQSNATCITDSAGLVSACLARAGAEFTDLAPAPQPTDRVAWMALDIETRDGLVREATAAAANVWPVITANLYQRFSKDGNRFEFEDAYFTRRRMLNALVIGEAIENQGRFLAQIDTGVQLICAEEGWQLPAHNSATRGGEILPAPDPKNPVVDLFSAETAALLAVVSATLGNALSSETRFQINREIATRVLQPYLARSFWWTGLLGGRMNNWTVWCTQNVLIAAFAHPYPAELRCKIVKRAAFSLDAFLAEYGEDGACREGAFYYKHAALCLFTALDVLNKVTGNAFCEVFEAPKIRNIAEYILLPHIAGEHYANFGDAAAIMAPPDARVYRFGKAVGSPDLINFAAREISSSVAPYDTDDINLFDRLKALFSAPEIAAHKVGTHSPREGFAESIGMFVARDDRFYVAANAGTNGGDHGHNDVGNVIVYKNGKPVLIDIGVETYTVKTFSAQRYDIWTMQSSFHNLPEFGGVMQQQGASFAAHDVQTVLDDNKARLDLDIARAYPEHAGVKSYQRQIELDRGTGVCISDQCQGPSPATLYLMMAELPEIRETTLHVGNTAKIIIEGSADIEIEEIAITDARLRASWPDKIYRARVSFAGQDLRLVIQ